MRYLVRVSVAALAGLLASFLAVTAAPAATTAQDAGVQRHRMVRHGEAARVHRGWPGGSPYAYRLAWSRWTSSSGKATGKLDLFWCVPTSSCKGNVHNVTVWATTPRTHNGLVYFAHLIYQYVNAKGVTKRLTGTFEVRPGASVPAWVGSL